MSVQPSISLPGSDLFYEDLIRTYIDTPHFIERSWFETQIETALEEPDYRFLLLTADPGAGKTTLAAWLAYKHANWPRYFIRRDQRAPLGGVDAHSMLLQIGFQLAATYPALFTRERMRVSVEQRVSGVGEGGQLTGVEIEKLLASPFYEMVVSIRQQVERNKGSVVGVRIGELVSNPRLLPLNALQYLALLDPAQTLLEMDPGARLVILIDALDELRFRPDQDSILKWLADSTPLPANVRFILTSRRDEMLDYFRQRQGQWIKEVTIEPQSEQVRADLDHYVMNFTSTESIRVALAEQDIRVSDFAAQVVEKTRGNFQYLSALARAIVQALEMGKKGHLDHLLRLVDVPNGLRDLYAFFLTLIKQAVANTSVEIETPDASTLSEDVFYLPAWEGLYIPILGILAVAQDSLTFDHIMNFAGVRAERTRLYTALGHLGQFLNQAGDRYRLYHNTFQEFLTSVETRDSYPAYYLEPARWHRKIAAHYRGKTPIWEDLAWKDVDDYGLLYLSAHLYGFKDSEAFRQELYGLICRSFMREKFARFGSHLPFERDVALATELARSEKPSNLVQIIRGHLINATVGSRTANVPPVLLTALIRVGRIEQACSLISLLSEPGQKLQAYVSIAEVLIALQKIAEARGVLMEALKASYALVDARADADGGFADPTLADALVDVAPLLDRIGALDEVQTVIEAFEDDQNRLVGRVLAILAESLGQKGMIDTAANIAKMALAAPLPTYLEDQMVLLIRVAQPLAQAGERTLVVEVMQTALVKIEILRDQLSQNAEPMPDWVPRYVAPALAWAGLFEQVDELMTEIADDEAKANALSEIAVARAWAGEFEEAVRAAQEIEKSDIKATSLSKIAQFLAQAGKFEEAMSVAQGIVMGGVQAVTLGEIALTAFRLKDSVRSDSQQTHQQEGGITTGRRMALQTIALSAANQSVALLESIEDQEIEVAVQDRWVEVMYRSGQLDYVLAVVENAPSISARAFALSGIAELLITANDRANALTVVERALEVTRQIVDRETSAAASCQIARLFAFSGDFPQSLEITSALPKGRFKLEALSSVADAFARTGQVEQAENVATQALMLSEAITDSTKLLHVLASMVQELAQVGQAVKGVPVAHWVRSAAGRIQDEELRAWAMVAVTQALAYIGEFAEASKIVEEIGTAPIDERLNEALLKAEAGQEVSAPLLEAFSTLGGNWYDLGGYRILAFSLLAASLLQAGETTRGVNAAVQVLKEVDVTEDKDRKVMALMRVAQALAFTGRFDAAMKVVELVSTRKQRISAYCEVAQALARPGTRVNALTAAFSALHLLEDGPIWSTLDGSQQILALDENIGLRQIEEWFKDEVVALSEVAQAIALASKSKSTRALEVANRALKRTEMIGLKKNRAIALSSVALALFQAGEQEQASETVQEAWAEAKRVEDEEGKAAAAMAFSKVMLALSSIGKAEQALEVFASALEAAAEVNRESFLDVLQDGAPLLAQREQGRVLESVCDVLMEIEDWWGA